MLEALVEAMSVPSGLLADGCAKLRQRLRMLCQRVPVQGLVDSKEPMTKTVTLSGRRSPQTSPREQGAHDVCGGVFLK
jgi:hypothetical protein